jgi:hypothetical protein
MNIPSDQRPDRRPVRVRTCGGGLKARASVEQRVGRCHAAIVGAVACSWWRNEDSPVGPRGRRLAAKERGSRRIDLHRKPLEAAQYIVVGARGFSGELDRFDLAHERAENRFTFEPSDCLADAAVNARP